MLAGAHLTRVEARRPDLRFPLPDGFVQRLVGARIDGLDRRGKYLIAALSHGPKLLTHLGMTGRFEISRAEVIARPGAFAHAAQPNPKHAHVIFETDRGATVTYFDARRFGFHGLAGYRGPGVAPAARRPWPGAAQRGVQFSLPESCIRGPPAKRQGPVARPTSRGGAGNIYVCEALHRARVSPLTPASAIGARKRDALVSAIRSVLTEAIAKGGSTLRDYASADGAMGYFQHSFEAYGREGHACQRVRCGGVIQRTVQAGRSTFFCPVCQT